MRFYKIISIALLLPICLSFSACNMFQNINFNNNELNDVDKYGRNIMLKLFEAIEKDDKEQYLNLFSSNVKGIVSDDSINEALNYIKGNNLKIDYDCSVESTVKNHSEIYKFDECLGFIKTTFDIYSFEYVLCKNEECSGIICLVISTEKQRDSDDYRNFIINTFNDAEFFDEKSMGVFIFK